MKETTGVKCAPMLKDAKPLQGMFCCEFKDPALSFNRAEMEQHESKHEKAMEECGPFNNVN